MKKIFLSVFLFFLIFTFFTASVSQAAPNLRKRMVKARVQGLRRIKNAIRKPVIRPEKIEMVPTPVLVPVLPPPRPFIVPKKALIVAPVVRQGGPALGLSAGLFANIPSGAGEIWFHRLFDMPGINLKSGLRYAQGADTNGDMRKGVLAFCDGIVNLSGGSGATPYIGGGLNYLAYTTGQKSGTVGAEVYLGVEEGNWATGSFYVEAGYGAIRTGFSPSYKGLNIDFGYKTGI